MLFRETKQSIQRDLSEELQKSFQENEVPVFMFEVILRWRKHIEGKIHNFPLSKFYLPLISTSKGFKKTVVVNEHFLKYFIHTPILYQNLKLRSLRYWENFSSINTWIIFFLYTFYYILINFKVAFLLL